MYIKLVPILLAVYATTISPPSQHHLTPHPPRTKYVGVNDQLILEDEVQRITLTGNLPSRDLVTGVVVALLGRDLHNGCFNVEGYCFAGGTQNECAGGPVVGMETDNKETK